MNSSGPEPYIPILLQSRLDRKSLITHYFNLGFTGKEILAFLLHGHGIEISLRHLKRILKVNGLHRRGNRSSPAEVIASIERELEGSGSSLGYRLMHQRLTQVYGLVVDRESVRIALKAIDPDGVERRKSHRLQRRQYRSKGPNYLWHIDGYDKLKPYGFCIHGAIDGYSRRILWLEMGNSNNDPRIIASCFLKCVRELGGTPRIIRSDRGTENVHVAAIQRFFRSDAVDAFSGEKSFLFGRSVSNQRIEAWWGFLRKSLTDWWINFFKDVKDQGIYNEHDPIQVECLRFCFTDLLKQDLSRVAKQWNLHRIRPSSNESTPPGRPDVLFFLPELTGTISYIEPVTDTDIAVAQEVCCDLPDWPATDAFKELADIILAEKHLGMPRNVQEGLNLYIELLAAIERIQ